MIKEKQLSFPGDKGSETHQRGTMETSLAESKVELHEYKPVGNCSIPEIKTLSVSLRAALKDLAREYLFIYQRFYYCKMHFTR